MKSVELIIDKHRISHKDAFELCYLRHQYLRKVKYQPTREDMLPYNKIVENFAKNTFYVYKNLFMLVGLDLEDVLNTSQVYLACYLGLFALEINLEKLENFKSNFRNHNSILCTEEDLLNKNKADFTCFLKQRLEDLVRVCRQKAKNIKGISAEEFVVYRGNTMPPKDIEDLLENHDKYGYKPLGTSVFKTIRKRMKDRQEGPVYLDNDVWYVCVPIRKKSLALTDFTCNNFSPYDNIHNMTPEEIFEKEETESRIKDNQLKFKSFSNKEKARIVKLFVNENQKNSKLKEEVNLARKFLENLNGRNI
jgi:hypothetical protein